jgi:FKBP-type peptidyl-prolyl cis-trans isomerase SlyD
MSLSASPSAGHQYLLDYTLSSEDEVVDTTVGLSPLWVRMGSGQLHPVIEQRIAQLNEGESFDFYLDPSVGFGVRDPQLRVKIQKKKLPEALRNLKTGDTFEAPGPDRKPKLFRVLEVGEYVIVVDGNHPLAGKSLHVEGRVLKIQANEERPSSLV